MDKFFAIEENSILVFKNNVWYKCTLHKDGVELGEETKKPKTDSRFDISEIFAKCRDMITGREHTESPIRQEE